MSDTRNPEPARSSDFPKYDVPSWKLPIDENATPKQLAAINARMAKNVAWFFSHPERDTFRAEEVGELLDIDPGEVPGAIRKVMSSGDPDAAGRYSRGAVFGTAINRCAWDELILRTAFAIAAAPERSRIADKDLAAIRSFFTEPRETYTQTETRAVLANATYDCFELLSEYGDAVPRATLGDFLRNAVPPVIVSRALCGLTVPIEMRNETRAIELPRWIWSVIDYGATKLKLSASETLSEELQNEIQGVGTSDWADECSDLMPRYADVAARR
jgi:hypothetical protein